MGTEMTFTLEQNEAAYIVRLLGGQPTEVGAFPLYQKVLAQYRAQEPKPAAQESAPAEPPVGGTD